MPECSHCDLAKKEVREMAKLFHNEENEDGILVASVDCASTNSELIC